MLSHLLALTLSFAPAPAGDGSVWDDLAECESGGNWHLDGTYDGGLQFAPSTWRAMGGPTEFAWAASREQQIEVARRLYNEVGWSAWPGCAARLGLSGAPDDGGSGSGGDEAPAPDTPDAPDIPQPDDPEPGLPVTR